MHATVARSRARSRAPQSHMDFGRGRPSLHFAHGDGYGTEMASRWRTWDPYFASDIEFQTEQLESTPVLHSFGRGRLRELAGQVLLPRVALESVLQDDSADTCCDVIDGRSRGGATSCMGGVACAPVKKASGRARALRLRAERNIVQQRRPGRVQRTGVRLMSQLSQKASRKQSSLATSASSSAIQDVADTTQHTCPDNRETKQPDAPPQPPNLQPHFVPENDVELPRPDSSCHTSDSTSEYSLELATSSPSQEELHTESGSARSSCEPRPRPATALQLDWAMDGNTLCFQNLPLSTTAKDLVEEIEEFGRVTHCTVLPQCNEAGLNTAFARMEERSACDWVLSCFHGNSYGDSPLQLACYYAC